MRGWGLQRCRSHLSHVLEPTLSRRPSRAGVAAISKHLSVARVPCCSLQRDFVSFWGDDVCLINRVAVKELQPSRTWSVPGKHAGALSGV